MKKILPLIFLGLLTLNVSANFYLLGYEEEQLFFNQFSIKDLEITDDGIIIGGTGSMSVNDGISILFYYNPDLSINQGTSVGNNPRRVYSYQESVHDSYKWINRIVMKNYNSDDLILMGLLSNQPNSYSCLVTTAVSSELYNETPTAPIILGAPEHDESVVEAICSDKPRGSIQGSKFYVSTSGSYPNSNPPNGYFSEYDLITSTVTYSVDISSIYPTTDRFIAMAPDKDGNIYCGSVPDAKLYRFDPSGKTFEDLGTTFFANDTIGISALLYDETNQRVYGGTMNLSQYRGGYLFYYDILQSTFYVVGKVDTDSSSVSISGLTYGDDGCIYGCTTGLIIMATSEIKEGNVFKYDPVTDEIEFCYPIIDVTQAYLPYQATEIVFRPQDRNFYVSTEAFNIPGFIYPGTLVKADFESPDAFNFKAELLNKVGDIKVSWERAYDDGNYFGAAIQFRILASTFPISTSAQFKNAFLDERVDGDSRQFSFNATYDSIYVNVIAYDDVYNPSPYNIPTRVIFNPETSPVIFPNPYKYGEHSGGIKFMNVPSKLKVFNIYTIAGELVADLNSLEGTGIESQVEPGVTQNGFIWDLNNRNGNLISSGTYIYYMEDINGNKFKGKLSFIK